MPPGGERAGWAPGIERRLEPLFAYRLSDPSKVAIPFSNAELGACAPLKMEP